MESMNEHIFEHTKRLEAKVASLEAHMRTLPTKADIDDAVQTALKETFISLGRTTKLGIITTATIVGSIVVIGGGFKWILAIFGFTYIGGSAQ